MFEYSRWDGRQLPGGVGVGREVNVGTSALQPAKLGGERVDEWTPALGQLTT